MKLSQRGPTIARILMGAIFVFFGLNGFLNFLPRQEVPAAAGAFAGALAATGYMFPLIKGVEVIGGGLLLSNRYVPLALALVAPNIVNIVLFHAFLAPSGVVVGLVLLALELYLAWSYRQAYRPMLEGKARPFGSATTESATTAPVGPARTEP